MLSKHCQFVRTASTIASSSVDELARSSVRIGRELAHPDARLALGRVHPFAERLHHFLTYIALAEHMLGSTDAHAGLSLGGYRIRLFRIVDDIALAFNQGEVKAASVLFGRRLAPSLLDYRSIADTVTQGLWSERAA
ncbi:MAG: hypothetical protein V3V08_04835 [Nannocystaceae bacterium]